jgi:hypothetical protein
MPTYKEGPNAINSTYNPTPYNNVLAGLNQKINASTFNAARVKSIILDSSHPRYEELGGDNSIGTIIYDDNIELPNPSNDIKSFPYARPLYSNIKNYPLINELVYVFEFPSTAIGTNTAFKQVYYINIIALWNHPHHNAYPDNPSALPPSQNKDYKQTSLGSVRRVTDNSTEINLGSTFKERSNIHPLLPFEGDFIIEGRWGNSIRIGSTVKNRPNEWSVTGNNGDPIVIIRNGQGKQNNQGWVPIVESINNDDASIYLGSTQQIPLYASSVSYNSYSSLPTAINQYNGKQIIINSNRIVFNASGDHILLSSAKSINLNALNSVNIDTKSTIIQSDDIKLGGKNATEAILKGDTTIQLLSELVTQLTNLSLALQTVTTPSGPAVAPAATQLATYLNTLKFDLESKTKSKISKTL